MIRVGLVVYVCFVLVKFGVLVFGCFVRWALRRFDYLDLGLVLMCGCRGIYWWKL